MGEVYKAKDTRLDRTIAITVLPDHVAADPDLNQRVEREAKIISSLNHPRICTPVRLSVPEPLLLDATGRRGAKRTLQS